MKTISFCFRSAIWYNLYPSKMREVISIHAGQSASFTNSETSTENHGTKMSAELAPTIDGKLCCYSPDA